MAQTQERCKFSAQGTFLTNCYGEYSDMEIDEYYFY